LASNEDADDVAKNLAKVVDFSSRLYLGATSALQVMAVFGNLRAWGAKACIIHYA
jgi:hypothetical protein